MDIRPLKIFSKSLTPRLNYILGIVLGDILGISFDIITDKRKLGKFNVINYSDEDIASSFKISPDTLLFENGISPREVEVGNINGLPAFFFTSDDSDFPFDIFAASFYLISRYEEYLPFEPDRHGRFSASDSLAYKNFFLNKPVVDLWILELARALLRKFQYMAFKSNDYNSVTVINSDIQIHSQGRGIFTAISGLFKSFKAGGNDDVYSSDSDVVVDNSNDNPLVPYEYIFSLDNMIDSDIRFLIPVSDQTDYDINPSWKSIEYRDLIARMNSNFTIGLHLSYYACDKPHILDLEVERLQNISGKSIALSQFKLVRFSLPKSYRDLQKCGIREDCSMGYDDAIGFRAGIARPFYFYDIIEECVTDLKVIPFQIMDTALKDYEDSSSGKLHELLDSLISATREVGGRLVSIWHCSSFSDSDEGHAFRALLEYTLKSQKS